MMTGDGLARAAPPPAPSAFQRITHRRNHAPQFRASKLYRAEWRTEAETAGGLDDLRAEILQTQAEMYVQHVEGRFEPGMTWRLSMIEEEMGLPDGELTGLTDEQRRDRLCGRLSSWPIPTANVIQMVAMKYAATGVQVYMDYEAFWITIRFTAAVPPPNLRDVTSEIIRILPAWLGLSWEVVYMTWGDLYEWGGTWGGLYNDPLQDTGAPALWQDLYVKGKDVLPPP